MRRACVVLAAFLLPGCAALARPEAVHSQYVREHWGAASGLPDTTIFAITQTPDGYLWLGTETGLVRFDGVRFKAIAASADPERGGGLVSALLPLPDGSLLAGTRNGLLLVRGSSVAPVPVEGPPVQRIVRCLFRDQEGRVWVGSDGAVALYADGRVQPWQAPAGDTPAGISRIGASGDSIWFLEGTRVFRLRGAVLDVIDAGFLSQTMAFSRQGDPWLFPPDAMVPVQGTSLGAPVPVPGSELVAGTTEDHDGILWFGGQSALHAYRNGRAERVELAADFSTLILAVYEDREHNLWIGTLGGGLWRLGPPSVLAWGEPEGVPARHVSVILAARGGEVWAGAQGSGLIRLDPVAGRAGIVDPFIGREVTALCEARDGTLWVGTSDGLFHGPARGPFAPVAATPKTPYAVLSIAELTDGSVMAGTTSGLLRGQGGTWREAMPSEGTGFALVILPEEGGTAWIATLGRGLFHWRAGKAEPAGGGEGLGALDLTAVARDPAGRLWVGTTDRGLFVRDGERFRALGTAAGVPPGPVYAVMPEAQGLWISGKNGIAFLPEDQVAAWIAGRARKVQVTLLGAADGMRSSECNGGAQPAVTRGADGALWFPTTDGMVRVDPAQVARPPAPSPPLLEELQLDERAVAVTDSLSLPAGRERLQIRFSSPGIRCRGRLEFAVRMAGYDPDWVPVGAERSVQYTNLPAGDFRFQVRVRAAGGPWTEGGSTILIHKSPHIWQTWPFAAACLLLLGGIVYGAWQVRVRALRRRFEAVLEERNRISREIHDSLTQSFAGVVLQLEAARGPGPEAPDAPLARAASIAREGLAEARRFVRGLRPLRLEGADLPTALSRMCMDAGASAHIAVSFRLEGRWREVAPAVEDEVFRIAQESVNNALRHAGASRVDVTLTRGAGNLSLQVQDDGKGFDPAAVHPSAEGGYGLKGMGERVARLGGKLDVRTAPGAGAAIAVEVPV